MTRTSRASKTTAAARERAAALIICGLALLGILAACAEEPHNIYKAAQGLQGLDLSPTHDGCVSVDTRSKSLIMKHPFVVLAVVAPESCTSRNVASAIPASFDPENAPTAPLMGPTYVAIASIVQLRLFGPPEDDIKEMSANMQSPIDSDGSVWSWQVEPNAGGKQTLRLQVDGSDSHGFDLTSNEPLDMEVNIKMTDAQQRDQLVKTLGTAATVWVPIVGGLTATVVAIYQVRAGRRRRARAKHQA